MKICYIANFNSIHTKRWVKYFSERFHHEVHLISPKRSGRLNGVMLHDIYPYNASLFSFYRAKHKLDKLLKEIRPDILHAHYVLPEGLIGAFSKFHPFCLTILGSDIYRLPDRSKAHKFLTRYVLKRADLITADSQDLKERVIRYGVSEDKVVVINWGIDLQRFNKKEDSGDIRKELGVSNSPIVLSMRRLEPLYNLDIFVKAIPLVLSHISNVRFLILGDGSMKKELVSIAKRLGVLRNIYFLGMVNERDIIRYLSIAQVFVSIPTWDGTSVSLLEAMALGVPIIVSDLPSNREWIKDGWNGFTVPVRDVEALAERIIFCLRNPELREIFRDRNLEIVKERADRKKEMERMERYYQGLVKKRMG